MLTGAYVVDNVKQYISVALLDIEDTSTNVYIVLIYESFTSETLNRLTGAYITDNLNPTTKGTTSW